MTSEEMCDVSNATLTYSEILAQVRLLDPGEQADLLGELAELVRKQLPRQRTSIRELRGLGKEIWEGIDAQEYVRQERAAWEE
jgi:hypothetical protein